MKHLMSLLSVFCMMLLIVAVAVVQTGCEEAKGLQGLQVDPPSAVLTTNGQTSVFAVIGGITNETLALPLTWRVSNDSLGKITHSSGYMAVYQRFSGNGQNTVIVRDQYDNEGYATIKQSAATYSLELTATATAIAVNQAVTITISTADAMAPFVWKLRSGPGSLTGESGSRSAAYSSGTAGTAVIEVKDSNGASGIIAIVVGDATPGGGGGGGGGAGGA